MTLQALTPEHLPALVIAPKRVAEHVWRSEVRKWRSDLTIAVAAGSPAKRKIALESDADIVAIGRDNVADCPEPGKFRTVILDELSSFKKPGRKRSRKVRRVTKDAAYVWGLTGTPSPNGYIDLWGQMALLDGGRRLGSTFGEYRKRYFQPGLVLPNGVVANWNPNKDTPDLVDALLQDICLSMRSEDYLDLPEVTENIVEVVLPPKARNAYESMSDDLVAVVDGQEHTAASKAVAGVKLAQISAGFLYPDAEAPGDVILDLHNEKIKAVEEIIEGTGSPVMVFYQFREEFNRLQKALPQAQDVRDDGVIDAWNEGRVPVMLAHPASAGHGLNLQDGGHTIVWSSLPWSGEQFEQANARLNRQGQTHPVTVHIIVADKVPGYDVFDLIVLKALKNKASVQDALMVALG